MIKHIVFYKLKDYSKENCEALRDMFLSMDGKISQIVSVNSYIDFLRSERSFDVALEVVFESPETMAEYQKDPYHVDVVKKYVHSVVTQSVAVDAM